jgi:hypothetical protein
VDAIYGFGKARWGPANDWREDEAFHSGSDGVSSVHVGGGDRRRGGTEEVAVIAMQEITHQTSTAAGRGRFASLTTLVVLGAWVASLAAPWKWF